MISFSLHVFTFFQCYPTSSFNTKHALLETKEKEKQKEESELAASHTAEEKAAMVLQKVILMMDKEHI